MIFVQYIKPYSIRILKNGCQHCEHFRFLSNSVSQPHIKSNVSGRISSSVDETSNVDSTTYSVIEPTEIKSLNIRKKIERYDKPGSVFKNLFLGYMDKDVLSFPFLLKSRQEFLELNKQYEMIRQTWNKIKKNEDTLSILKYDSLYELSVSEMMYIFEAIGASVAKNLPFGEKEDEEYRYKKKLSKTFNMKKQEPYNIGDASLDSFHNVREIIKTIVPLIEQNSIVYYALSRSLNDNIKKIIKKKPKIAFAYEEEHPEKTDIHINKWSSEAQLTYDSMSWVISGHKNRILDQDYSYYLVFNKVNKSTPIQSIYKFDNDIGIVALLVPANQVKIENDGLDYFAIQHQKIKFDLLELDRNSYEVINATKDLSVFCNTKGCGQLSTSAFILGLLKQLQKNTYGYLVNNFIGLANCELIQYKLFQSTCKIYALESMIYLTAAMFDSFEIGNNLEGESITAKILAVEYAYDIINELRSIFGSRYPFSSIAYDLIYYLDSYLGSSMHNRIHLGNEAVKHYKIFQEMTFNSMKYTYKLPIYRIKNYLKQRKLRNYESWLTREITQFIHHNMHPACDWIEHCANVLQFSMYFLNNLHKDEINEKHFDLNRVTTIAMDTHMMISCLSRANHSLCYGFRNNHTEKEICMAICKEAFLKNLQRFEEINKTTMVDNDNFARDIFEMNLREKGYFAKLFQVNSES